LTPIKRSIGYQGIIKLTSHLSFYTSLIQIKYFAGITLLLTKSIEYASQLHCWV